MKQPGPELGDLSSRFFAYIQLKGKDIIRTGELFPVLGISESKERSLLHRLSKSGWIVRLKRGVYLVPPRLPAGGKYSPGVALILQKLMAGIKSADHQHLIFTALMTRFQASLMLTITVFPVAVRLETYHFNSQKSRTNVLEPPMLSVPRLEARLSIHPKAERLWMPSMTGLDSTAYREVTTGSKRKLIKTPSRFLNW
jgi:hypothetical protein